MSEAKNGAGFSAPTPFDAAQYIQQLTGELHIMAARCGFGFLAYLLKMAEEEASTLTERFAESRGNPVSPPRDER